MQGGKTIQSVLSFIFVFILSRSLSLEKFIFRFVAIERPLVLNKKGL